MKVATLVSIALSTVILSWLLFVAAELFKRENAPGHALADFYVQISDEAATALPDVVVRIDGKLVGKTNATGVVSKSAVTIGSAPAVIVSTDSASGNLAQKRSIRLNLPEYDVHKRPVFSVVLSLCLKFVVCEQDAFAIRTGLIASSVAADNRAAKVRASSYHFASVRPLESSDPTNAIIQELRKILEREPNIQNNAVAIVLDLGRVSLEGKEEMMRVVGRRAESTSIDHEIAFLFKKKSTARGTAQAIYDQLIQARPGFPGGSGRRWVTVSTSNYFRDSFEVYAGGVGGQVESFGRWRIQVPDSGRFWLTILDRGKLIKRKFFDVTAFPEINLDE